MTPHTAKQHEDHLGNVYPSFADMCKAYNKPSNTVRNRLDRNWTLEQALTIDNKNTAVKVKPIKIWTDHLGNEFPSVRAMAEHYGITEKIFWSRKRILNWPLEKILTTPIQDMDAPANAIPIVCNGIEFKSVNALCKYYCIPRTTFKLRLQQGYTPDEAVNIKPKKTKGLVKTKITDPWGKEFPSLAALCKEYHVTKDLVRSRLDLGWTMEKILTNPQVIDPHKPCIGPDGKQYDGFKIMAESFGLSESTLRGRLAQGYSLEDAIYNWENNIFHPQTDHLGNKFNATADMMLYWNISNSSYWAYMKRRNIVNPTDKDKAKVLDVIKPKKKFADITIVKKVAKNYYEICKDNKNYIWSHDQIWNYYRSTINIVFEKGDLCNT